MLTELNIKNIALIEALNLKFYDGLNILSGETGAGKSIIIDSLNFVIGERADKTLIRHGTDFATVEAVFTEYQTKDVKAYLQSCGFEVEEMLIISRRMTLEGKNECRINGKMVTLSMLKGLTELLCDIHGQHQHQSLLRVSHHLSLIDSLSDASLLALKNEVSKNYKNYIKIIAELENLGDSIERERRCDILSYQIDEIENAEIYEGEEDELLEKRKRIRNMESILSSLDESFEMLDGFDSTSALNKTKIAVAKLDSIVSFDSSIKKLVDRLESARIEIKDIADEVQSLQQQLDFDARTAEETEKRLEIVRNLLRKYGGSAEKLFHFLQDAKAQLFMLQNASGRVDELRIEKTQTEKMLISSLKKLTETRKKTALDLENKITKELSDLGMGGSTFKVEFRQIENDEQMLQQASANGCDNLEFMISPNVGEPLKPLVKIISGGEMSRFMLALKNILSDIDNIKTLVFDEIDTGISGHIAEIVASKLCNISRSRQVLAVTHLPQLAAMADNHYLIEKHARDGKTKTTLTLLSDNLPEIARLIGGSDYSGFALPHAKEMKEWSAKYKSQLE